MTTHTTITTGSFARGFKSQNVALTNEQLRIEHNKLVDAWVKRNGCSRTEAIQALNELRDTPLVVAA